ncbi:PREDICTED: protein MTO1 homolog, mitochondrial isoform X1 [Nicrophorus vespilloides]|uniref:Protein MTO1 homolog, mitochondrial isoform X1 n=2 Tax=Nicrophorus vespilloides TaxID=110193 RepID=A0ABM1MM82_NICVS|nr:PREDICTED: protein MTO1 homolog, mitochondrial isoform X1 [Nicrophorus vespilloides]
MFNLIKHKKLINIRTFCTKNNAYDVIVVGGGHAGTEACAAAARMGAKTLLVTHKKSTVGEMSCNPSFGGIGKGHLLREVDALDGVCSKICDLSGIQYKVLNKRKGPAVWGLRAQIDRVLYKTHLQNEIFNNTKNLDIIEASVEDLITENGDVSKCCGILLADGTQISSKTVVITTGTFLKAQINIGLKVFPAGRMGDASSIGLANTLERIGLQMGRLKTGTPPRLRANSIDYDKCTVQGGDDPPVPFSFMSESVWIKPEDQLDCFLTNTSLDIEPIVKDNIHLNKHVAEEVTGPRYCPSIESKILKFGGRIHHVWLEPEGFDSDLIYPNGLSCTLPEDLQQILINKIPALEKAEIVKPGYGVEYEFVDPRELRNSLELKKINGLFLAGQINGTTGYEEAAAQGIIAGINAAAKCLQRKPLILSRTEGYIGVLIDDLTTLGTNEPYRIFTSRAEFRLTLRPDNADLRLTKRGYDMGCVSEERYKRTEMVYQKLSEGVDILKSRSKTVSKWRELMGIESSVNNMQRNGFEMMQSGSERITVESLAKVEPTFQKLLEDSRIAQRLEIEALYHMAIASQAGEVEEVIRDEALLIPLDLDYNSDSLNMSLEDREKLIKIQPPTIAAASRIPGVTPSAVYRLLRFVKNTTLEKRPNKRTNFLL